MWKQFKTLYSGAHKYITMKRSEFVCTNIWVLNITLLTILENVCRKVRGCSLIKHYIIIIIDLFHTKQS